MKIKTGLAKNIIRAQVVEALRWNTLNNMLKKIQAHTGFEHRYRRGHGFKSRTDLNIFRSPFNY